MLKAAKVAADISVAFETDLPPGELPDEIDPGTVETDGHDVPGPPYGWKAKQIAAEHPNAMFSKFRRGTINEAARCMNMPPNIAMCDSAGETFTRLYKDGDQWKDSSSFGHDDLPLLTPK